MPWASASARRRRGGALNTGSGTQGSLTVVRSPCCARARTVDGGSPALTAFHPPLRLCSTAGALEAPQELQSDGRGGLRLRLDGPVLVRIRPGTDGRRTRRR